MAIIYVIERLWIDPMENHDAYGFRAIGYVTTKERAIEICNSEFVEKSKYPWPLDCAFEFEGDKVPRYRYRALLQVTDTMLLAGSLAPIL